MEPPSTPFALQTSFPPVIFSYCTKTDGGRGEQRMWQIANFLKKHGIASFNGKQVEVGEDWMQKWLGKMPEADVCLAPRQAHSRGRQGPPRRRVGERPAQEVEPARRSCGRGGVGWDGRGHRARIKT